MRHLSRQSFAGARLWQFTHWVIGLAAGLIIASDLVAQGSGNAPADSGAKRPAPIAAMVPTLDSVRVDSVFRHRPGDPGVPETARVSAGLGDVIYLRVRHLIDLTNHSKCLSAKGEKVAGCVPRAIALYLDGREISGLAPESGAPRPEDDILQFHLSRSAASDEAWADLLGAPSIRDSTFFRRPTEVSVGLTEGYALPTNVHGSQFDLIRIRKLWFVACSILLIVVIGLLVWLGVSSDLLRDAGPQPPAGSRKTYSLARFQMATWFALVIGGFVYIWLITGGWDTVTPTVLALMGIGAGTALGAAVIDANKQTSNTATLTSLRAEEPVLVRDIAALDAQLATATDAEKPGLRAQRDTKATRLQLVRDQIAAAAKALDPGVSRAFLDDMLTDGTNGYSFHRFQMFVWTLVLAILFIYSVWARLAMPDFSATLLALLGISGGTYLGFKLPEQSA
jgi:hypothetical protein